MSKTLNDYIPILKTAQQDYIVFCVQKYSDRSDFHRGLLPFLPAEEAARCLEFQLESLKEAQNVNDPEQQGKGLLGEKFIRQIISVFRGALVYRLSEHEESEIIYLNTVKLKKMYGKRFGKKFCIRIQDLGVIVRKPIDGLVELQMISRNKWKVTSNRAWLGAATSYLSDVCDM